MTMGNGNDTGISRHFARFALVAITAIAATGCGAADPGEASIGQVSEALSCANALIAPISATASSIQNSTLPAAAAIDNNLNTRWSSLSTDPQWLYVDYGSSFTFSEVKITWESAYSSSYVVQISNNSGGPWTNVYTKNAFAGGVDDTTGLGVNGRYLRVYSYKRGTQFGNSIKEIQAYGVASACGLICAPSAVQCLGPQYQTCGANGMYWTSPVSCPGSTVCDGNACVDVTSSTTVDPPTAYYPFDTIAYDPTNPVPVDVAGNGYHGTPYNTMLTTGKLGNSFDFNGLTGGTGTASGVKLGQFGTGGYGPLQGSVTMCSWVRPISQASGPGQPIFSVESGAAFEHFAVASASPGAGTCGGANQLFMSSANGGCRSSGLTVTPNVWNHVCFTYAQVGCSAGGGCSQPTVTLYVNGASKAFISTLSVGIYDNSWVGISQVTDPSVRKGAFNGSIDEVALWPYPEGASSIQALYDSNKGAKAGAGALLGAGSQGLAAVQVSQGANHSCALMSDGSVWCWGANNRGQLGRPASTTSSATGLVVEGVVSIKKIAAVAEDATCALGSNGAVQCWGENAAGQLGQALSVASSNVPLTVPNVAGATDIEGGHGHVCVILADKTMKCWGSNGEGELGIGNAHSSSAPPTFVLATTGAAGSKLGNVTALASGGQNQHMCAITNNGVGTGALVCWGDDLYYQLGVDAQGRSGPANTSCYTGEPCAPYPLPVLNPAGLTIKGVALGFEHTCVLASDGKVRCDGTNPFGQLGLPFAIQDENTPTTPVSVNGVDLTNVAAIFAGGLHSCAKLTDGTASCWGSNGSGELGNEGTDGGYYSPVAVHQSRFIATSKLAGVTTMSSGDRNTCAVARGVVYCWGRNDGNQLGTGGFVVPMSNIPLPVQ